MSVAQPASLPPIERTFCPHTSFSLPLCRLEFTDFCRQTAYVYAIDDILKKEKTRYPQEKCQLQYILELRYTTIHYAGGSNQRTQSSRASGCRDRQSRRAGISQKNWKLHTGVGRGVFAFEIFMGVRCCTHTSTRIVEGVSWWF